MSSEVCLYQLWIKKTAPAFATEWPDFQTQPHKLCPDDQNCHYSQRHTRTIIQHKLRAADMMYSTKAHSAQIQRLDAKNQHIIIQQLHRNLRRELQWLHHIVAVQ